MQLISLASVLAKLLKMANNMPLAMTTNLKRLDIACVIGGGEAMKLDCEKNWSVRMVKFAVTVLGEQLVHEQEAQGEPMLVELYWAAYLQIVEKIDYDEFDFWLTEDDIYSVRPVLEIRVGADEDDYIDVFLRAFCSAIEVANEDELRQILTGKTYNLTRHQFANFLAEIWKDSRIKAWAESDLALWRGIFEVELGRSFQPGKPYCPSDVTLNTEVRRWVYTTTSGTRLEAFQRNSATQELTEEESRLHLHVNIPPNRLNGNHGSLLNYYSQTPQAEYFKPDKMVEALPGSPEWEEFRRRTTFQSLVTTSGSKLASLTEFLQEEGFYDLDYEE